MIKKLREAAILFMAVASGAELYQFPNRRMKLNKLRLDNGETRTATGDDFRYMRVDIYDERVTSDTQKTTVSVQKPLPSSSTGTLISRKTGGYTDISFSEYNFDFFVSPVTASKNLCYAEITIIDALGLTMTSDRNKISCTYATRY